MDIIESINEKFKELFIFNKKLNTQDIIAIVNDKFALINKKFEEKFNEKINDEIDWKIDRKINKLIDDLIDNLIDKFAMDKANEIVSSIMLKESSKEERSSKNMNDQEIDNKNQPEKRTIQEKKHEV